MKKVLPWQKCPWKKCKPKYPKNLFMPKIRKNIFLPEEEEEEEEQELSLPVLLLWQNGFTNNAFLNGLQDSRDSYRNIGTNN